ncbi:MAG TPA: YihY/virulence factor BrkB family protein [Planctomycetota bacterium]|jgi:membrane protein|nr:YihY/virulence factor BrkB family protein [Planctomycetota bacterium]
MASRLGRFLAPHLDRVYALDLAAARRPVRWLLVLARAFLAAFQAFRSDGCAIRASSLTYVTFIAIVPVLALAAAVAKGLGASESLWSSLEGPVKDLPPAVQSFFADVRRYVDNTRFGTLTAFSLLLLLWTALSLFSRIEAAFQAIWRVRRPRGGIQRYGNYLSVLFLAPLLVLVASAANAAIAASGFFSAVVETVPLLDGALAVGGLLVPVAVQIGVFTLLYGTLPRTRVPWRAALAGGIAGGLLWQGLQTFYFRAQVGVSKYNAIYGGFAAIPLSLIFLYCGWAVLLFGAEFAHAWERAPRARGLREALPPRPLPSREALLAVMAEAAEAFRSGAGPWVAPGRTGLLRDEAEEAVEGLVQAGLLLRAEASPEGVVPARPPEGITAREVAEAGREAHPAPGSLPPELARLCARADRAAAEALAGYAFGASPPPLSSTPGAPR